MTAFSHCQPLTPFVNQFSLSLTLPYDLFFQDLESTPKTVSFAKNGTFFGTAYELDDNLNEQALFPHVATKNVQVSVNFAGPPWCETPDIEGYLPIQDATDEHKVLGAHGPATLAECEVIMLVGLPASGKTTWAKKHCNQNKDKKYNILGEWVCRGKTRPH